MDVMGLLILLLPALAKPSLAVSREYHLVSQTKTWNDAQSYCRENFHDLATVESEEDWIALRAIVASVGGYLWIGMYEDINSWRWSRDNTSLYGNGNTLESWFNFEAANTGGHESCGCTYNKQPFDCNCQDLFKSVCYDEESNTFIPVSTPMTWLSALSYCSQTYTELADLRTQEDFTAVTSVIDNSVWWFGLSRETWKWSDRSDFSFKKWDAGQPHKSGGDCGCTQVNGWHDDYCTNNRPFICSVRRKKVLKFELKTDGSIDPNDPQVQEAALKQMENRLREQGVHPGVRLRWSKYPDGKVFNKTEL